MVTTWYQKQSFPWNPRAWKLCHTRLLLPGHFTCTVASEPAAGLCTHVLYAFQLCAIPLTFPHKVLMSKLWRFWWQQECIQWKWGMQKAQLCTWNHLVLSVIVNYIVCFFYTAPASNMQFQVKGQVDNLLGFKSHLVSLLSTVSVKI